MVEKVVVVGAGGFGRELAWLVSRLDGYEVVGFVDDSESLHGSTVNGYPVLGTIDWLVEQQDAFAVGMGIGIPRIKAKVVERLRGHGHLTFPAFVAPTAEIGPEVAIGEGVVVTDGCTVTCNTRLGDFVMLNLHVTVGHDCDLGDFVTVSPGGNLSGFTTLGRETDIGTNAVVIPGKSIGENCVIGASACVTSDIPANATAVGIPAKVIRQG